MICQYCFHQSGKPCTLQLAQINQALEVGCSLPTLYDLTGNLNLQSVVCTFNNLSFIDVTNNLLLETLYTHSNPLLHLDVTNNTQLTTLGCASNELDSLDLTNNVELDFLQCGTNPFVKLDLSHNINLTYIEIRQCCDLEEVCVWVLPFPPAGVTVSAYGIDTSNIDFLICYSGIDDNEYIKKEELTVYPNPSNGVFSIHGEDILKTEVYNFSGELLVSGDNKCDKIDLSNYPKGIYILKLHDKDSVINKKIVLQ